MADVGFCRLTRFSVPLRLKSHTLHKLFPKLRLLLREAFTHDLLASLTSGAIDAALLALPVPLESLTCEVLFAEPFVVALPAAHPLSALAMIRPVDLAEELVLLLEEGHCLRDQALDLCARRPARLAEEIRGTSLETLRQMVSLGVGCTIMPLLAVSAGQQLQSKLIQYRPFSAPVPSRTIGLVWRRRALNDLALRTIADTLRAHAPDGVSPAVTLGVGTAARREVRGTPAHGAVNRARRKRPPRRFHKR